MSPGRRTSRGHFAPASCLARPQITSPTPYLVGQAWHESSTAQLFGAFLSRSVSPETIWSRPTTAPPPVDTFPPINAPPPVSIVWVGLLVSRALPAPLSVAPVCPPALAKYCVVN